MVFPRPIYNKNKMKTAKEIFDELNSWDENRRIEAKSASAVGKSMMETVCAFANEPGLRGGYLLLGAKRTGMTEEGKPVYEPENIGGHRQDSIGFCGDVQLDVQCLYSPYYQCGGISR